MFENLTNNTESKLYAQINNIDPFEQNIIECEKATFNLTVLKKRADAAVAATQEVVENWLKELYNTALHTKRVIVDDKSFDSRAVVAVLSVSFA